MGRRERDGGGGKGKERRGERRWRVGQKVETVNGINLQSSKFMSDLPGSCRGICS